jgi:hypothetical protein
MTLGRRWINYFITNVDTVSNHKSAKEKIYDVRHFKQKTISRLGQI